MSTTTQVGTRPVPADATEAPRRHLDTSHRVAWAFLAPFGLFYLVFILGPLAYQLVSSFFSTSLVRPGIGSALGFGNYAEVLTSATFWIAVRNTLVFTVLTAVPLVLLGLAMAILVNRVARAQWLFRLAFFAPYVLPSATMALIWYFLYSPELGLIDSLLSALGVGPAAVLGNPLTVLPAIALSTIWWTLGFNFVLYLAGLQEIPRDLYEAASLDGASTWEQIRYITVPLLARTTTLVLVLQIINSLKVFDQIFIMTGGAGGPDNASIPVLMYVYNTSFTDYRVGAASAASMVFFLLILGVSAVWLTLTRRNQGQVNR
jgi:multiple sugar transport system permease protein